MARVSGSYQSVTRGVSQQVPQDRRPGQHWEQVNMLSDPVRGTARRHGSVMLAEMPYATGITEANKAATLEDTKQYREYGFRVAGKDYSLLYRSRAKPANSAAPAFFAYSKDGAEFLEVVRPVTDTFLDSIEAAGVSALTNVGRYVLLAGSGINTAASTNNVWAAASNKRTGAVWIRGGAYSRTFTIKYRLASGALITASYKTMSSAYEGTLDTSSIPASDPEYQKKVNDATSAYNTAVTQHIAAAAADIQPENIAEKLRQASVSAGIPTAYIGRVGAHVVVASGAAVVSIDASDGGDGTFIRAAIGEVANADELTQVHLPGTVIRIIPKKTNEDDAFYLKAYPKDESNTSWGEVTWREAAGVEYTPTQVFAVGTVHNNKFYVAGTPAALATLTGLDVPQFVTNGVGDAVSSPLPKFFGRPINYLGLFQDRLVIGAGADLLMSRPGEYFNWWRTSVLTIEDADPIEFFATAGADDTIRASTTYDRNLVLFGDRWQYSINGRQPITPITQSVTVMSAHEDAVDAIPVNSGNLAFFAKKRAGVSSLHQIQIGLVQDSPEAYEVSQQLDTYLVGEPVEIRASTAPNTVLLRTDMFTNGVYVYTYLDSPGGGERLFDSWSKWEWHEDIGNAIGATAEAGDFIIFTSRVGKTSSGADALFVVADRFTLEGRLSDRPYLDSQRPVTSFLAPTADTWLHGLALPSTLEDTYLALGKGSDDFLTGGHVKDVMDIVTDYGTGSMFIGLDSPAYVTPTNPFMRDREGRAVLSGRLTLVSALVSVADTGAMFAFVESSAGTKEVLHFVGRYVGTSEVGKQPVVTRSLQLIIGKEVRESKYTLRAGAWLPLTVTAIEWKGQVFNNSR